MPIHERLLTEDILDYSHTTRALTESKWFIVQKKDGTKIGLMNHRLTLPARWIEISYGLTPNERRKEYGTEAVQLMVDYLFLSKDIARIQAIVDVRHIASQRVLEKAGFQREGTMRDESFDRGEWRDFYLYSILRREWKEPRILTKTLE
ncbi:MAG: GNAT family protein [Candidatus Bathyarchaeia archaeon]|jgi:ribosomal-protein-alanine N-acetyltransferase